MMRYLAAPADTFPLLAELNLAPRFVLELGGVVGGAYWGYHAGRDRAVRIALAVAAPVLLIVS